MKKTSEQFYHCRKCKKPELCKVTDMGRYLLVHAFVCGQTARIPKEAANE